jgi:hypothetical protein
MRALAVDLDGMEVIVQSRQVFHQPLKGRLPNRNESSQAIDGLVGQSCFSRWILLRVAFCPDLLCTVSFGAREPVNSA